MKKLVFFVFAAAALAACQPTVQLQAPDKPIVINMNVHIDHEVRVKVDRDLDKTVFSKDSPLF